jgi:GNAT superfamily N-acetyltransferase
MILRDADPADRAHWDGLWQGFLDYYDTTLPPAVTDSTWARLMDPASPMKMRLAVVEGTPLGFAIHQHHPSTWVLGDDCYLEDLFVDPAARGQGLGRALINDLMTLARARGWHRLYWNTEATNATARKLYDSFVENDGHIRYRLTL